MQLIEFDYTLPKELIAQKPILPRDHCKLMVVNRKTKEISHHFFYQIDQFLKKGDVVVINTSKVIPARLLGKKVTTDGKVEIFLIRPNIKNLKNYQWNNEWIVIGKPGLKKGEKIKFSFGLEGEIEEVNNYERLIKFNTHGEKLKKLIYKNGQAPTPPYIKRLSNLKEYQTIYAKNLGSVAAPTAGFHFTPRLIKKLKKKGVIFKEVILHIGLGTFEPVKTEIVENHQMDVEWAEIDEKTAKFLNKAKKNGQRIIAVGTTTTRTLEGFASKKGVLKSGQKFVNLFIYPGYQFKFTDALITNFHLPKSTLIMLVSALAGKDLIFQAYNEAIKKHYRFYSFGDAMFII
ncbi:MAG: tRNA preQ1(34) S-adenosylmethionine ribosyltransferase-isomerase QueA [Parcubacteria group bacterium]|nr:tRNA preQ1(34) S-adenosylmethionine ribosyltransferase-isomerase QueA [Parcubacteria group bacterium]